MSGSSVDERRSTANGLEVVIHRPGALTLSQDAVNPSLVRVLDLMTALKDFYESVAVAWMFKGAGLDENIDLLKIPPTSRHVVDMSSSDEVGRLLKVRRISMNSPLTLELITTSAGGVGVVSAVVFLFKNPDKIGEWFPKLQTSWYNGRAEAEKAKKAYEKLRKARTQVRELER